MKAATRKPCRRCGAEKGDHTPHQWYCAPCAEAVFSERNKERNRCGADHAWVVGCKECQRIKKQIQYDTARRGAETRRKNRPNYFPPVDAQKFWQRRAHVAVKLAIKVGLLPDLKGGEYVCMDCGGVAQEYEHRDYGRPLEVEPVCRCCNKRRGTAKWPSPQTFKRIQSEGVTE